MHGRWYRLRDVAGALLNQSRAEMRIRRILGGRSRTDFNARTVELYLAALTCPHHLRNVNPALALVWLRQKHPGPLKVIRDNTPAHRGEALREHLCAPSLGPALVWSTAGTSKLAKRSGAGREKRRRGTCALEAGRRCKEKVSIFLTGPASRKDEVKRRCRTVLQSRAEGLASASLIYSRHTPTAHATLPSV